MRHILATIVFALIALTGPAIAQSEEDVMQQIENLHGKSTEFGDAFAQLQDAFLFDDPTAIADLGLYPIAVNANGETYDIVDAQDLVDNVDSLLSEQTMAALAGQEFADLIVTSEGVGFANGALWMSLVCTDDSCSDSVWGIVSINN